MIDFSTLKGLTIPEGNVKQISDASGRVLWSAVKMATLTITGTGDATYSHVTIDGVKYTSPAKLEVPVGMVITCWVGDKDKERGAWVTVNGSFVLRATSGGSYDYTVVGNATIQLNYSGGVGSIAITEIPEGYALVTITGGVTSIRDEIENVASVTINGTTYSDSYGLSETLVVPVGTEIYCTAIWGDYAGGGYVYVNDTQIGKYGYNTEYTYIVDGDASIKLERVNYGGEGGYWGSNVRITET